MSMLIKLILICLIIPMLSNCALILVGYAPISSEKTVTEVSALGASFVGVSGKRVTPMKNECSSYIRDKSEAFSTKEELLKEWGKPDKIEKNDIVERFIYNGSLQFSGIFAVVMIVPIPIIFPSQRRHCIVEMENGLIKRLEKIQAMKERTYGCAGFFFQEKGGEGAFHCGAD